MRRATGKSCLLRATKSYRWRKPPEQTAAAVHLKSHITVNHHVEYLLSQIKCLATKLKGPDSNGLCEAETDLGLIRELKGLARQLVQINTNSLSRATRENIRSVLVESAPFILPPEDVDIIQAAEHQHVELSQELSGVCTRAARRDPTRNLRKFGEQQMLFIRGALKNPLQKRAKLRRESKHYSRTKRALRINTQQTT